MAGGDFLLSKNVHIDTQAHPNLLQWVFLARNSTYTHTTTHFTTGRSVDTQKIKIFFFFLLGLGG